MKKTHFPFCKSTLIAICLALLIYTVALAASGDLDTTFSGDGKIVQSFGGTVNRGFDVAVQPDGKVVVVGEKWTSAGRDLAIARYNTNGSLDTTFSGDGKQVVNVRALDQAVAVAIQTDGKIVVGGQTCNADGTSCDVAVVRLNANGNLDTSFSGDGKVTTDLNAGDNGGFDMALMGNKIVVAGYMHDGSSYNAAIYQYLSNGNLDSTFSGDGILTINFGMEDFFNGVVISSGKIHVAGWSGPSDGSTADFITARVNSNGTMDATFSGDGKIKTSLGTLDYAGKLAVSSGKVIVVGSSDNKIAIVQYTASGALDTTFSGDGKLKSNLGFPSPSLYAITIQGGKIVVSGRTDSAGGDALLARFTSTGNLDATFSGDGIVTTDWGANDIYRSVLYKNSRLYVVGESSASLNAKTFIIAAYLP